MEITDEDNISDWVFNFESDHLALRGNREYSRILKTIALLESQKIKIHNDIEQIILSQNGYLRDPLGFVNDIYENKFIPPKYMCVVSIPDFSQTNAKNDGNETGAKSSADTKVRGRVFDQTKPETFNQLWTCGEQRRLEQLLTEYPVEPVEMRRFAKIAVALGNRTPQQVASRVQKFFKKLHSVGMPVPGRIPKNKKNVFSKSKNFYKSVYRQSTFFPAHDVPVNIPDDDMFITGLCATTTTLYCNDYASLTLENESLDYKKNIIDMLQIMRTEKLTAHAEQIINPSEKCENCMEPNNERRWICNTCCISINLCTDCIIYQLLSKVFVHTNHEVKPNKEIQ